MAEVQHYSCPSCGAPLIFSAGTQNFHCDSCGGDFDRQTLELLQESDASMREGSRFDWDNYTPRQYTPDDSIHLSDYTCPTCGAEIVGEDSALGDNTLGDNTVGATLCPYCGGSTIIKKQFEGTLMPDLIIPFQVDKKKAMSLFQSACARAPFLPDSFRDEQKLEKITGVYVPFWLFDCHCSATVHFRAHRTSFWSDSRYNYVKTDYYRLIRQGEMNFEHLPVDGSLKADDAYMEALEPFHYEDAVPFDSSYLAGFWANKYDVSCQDCQPRANRRIETSMEQCLAGTAGGFEGVTQENAQVSFSHGKIRYALLPVWMLNIRYQNVLYRYAVNGQTGKVVGDYPICKKKRNLYFAKIYAIGLAAAAVIGAFAAKTFLGL